AEDLLAAVARLGPHRAALAGPMHDPVRRGAQRHHGTRMERRGLWQTSQTRGDPAAMQLRELFRLRDRASRRHGQYRLAISRMNAQRVTTRTAMPAHTDRKDLRAMLDQESRRFVGAPIQERTSGHVSQSGGQEFARILPYPKPAKSPGAKTNHLPNIQGLPPPSAPTKWVRNRKF